jgi:uncharacterized protein YecE (DUF72 family)
MHGKPCFVGCAGWSLPRAVQDRFDGEGTHLQRYASRFRASEINSSFYRPHAPGVWRRWADSVPPGFLFSVKLPKTITHEQRLVQCAPLLAGFMRQARLLGDHLGCLLVQMPPSLAFDAAAVHAFMLELRAEWEGWVAAEPRHISWFTPEADELLMRHRIARVLADPVRHEAGAMPGGWPGIVYLRLHGSPRMYYSAYEATLLDALARRIRMEQEAKRPVWCIFDNTAAGAAADNALTLQAALDHWALPLRSARRTEP